MSTLPPRWKMFADLSSQKRLYSPAPFHSSAPTTPSMTGAFIFGIDITGSIASVTPATAINEKKIACFIARILPHRTLSANGVLWDTMASDAASPF